MEYDITNEEFEQFRSLVYQQSGISLNDGKKALLLSRLSKRLRALSLERFQDYYELVTRDPAGEEFTVMLNLLSTNKTDFFREPKHFTFLQEHVLPAIGNKKHMRIWSSACSSGEEPYTIAMTLYDGVSTPSQWDWKILASDLSTQVLAKASAGLYEQERVRNLPLTTLRRHFMKGHGQYDGQVKVKPHLADMIRFQRINLMAPTFPIKSPLDVIFCRNVMIYFDRPTQQGLVAKFHRYLKPGGYLFIGHSESLQWITHPFGYVAPTIYRKEG